MGCSEFQNEKKKKSKENLQDEYINNRSDKNQTLNTFSSNPNYQPVNNKETNLLIKNLQEEKTSKSPKNLNTKKYISKGNSQGKIKKNPLENIQKEMTPTISYQPSTSNLSQANNQKDNKIMVGPINKRTLTLKSLLEMINEIYNSKFQRDKQLTSSHLPKETLEQHMYSYFNIFSLSSGFSFFSSGFLSLMSSNFFSSSGS